MKTSVIGHGPEDFANKPSRIINKVLADLSREYGSDLLLLFNGQIGIAQWACSAAIERSIRYGLFIPCLPEQLGQYWYEDQSRELNKQFNLATETYIGTMKDVNYLTVSDFENSNHQMIDESNLVIAFWLGKKRGPTYNAIKYALEKDRIILNAMEKMSLMTKKDL